MTARSSLFSLWIIAVSVLFAGCSSDTTQSAGAPPAPPSNTVTPPNPPTTTYNLTVNVNGGGSVTGTGINCPTDCTETYAGGSSVTLNPTAGANYSFSGWNGPCSVSGNACTVSMTQVRSVTAAFSLNSYNLSVAVNGTGTVTSGTAIACPADCSETYSHGTSVTLTATPGANASFSGWGGSCGGTTPTCVLSVTAARNVTANFTGTTPAPTTYNLTLSVASGSGTLTPSPAGTSCGSGCYTYASGTSVSVSAVPTAGYQFSIWGGQCAGSGACTVAMSANRSVSANFTAVVSTGDLCDGLVTDKLAHNMTALAKPGYLQTVVDPEFGTTIRRISNAGSGGVIKPAYSTIPAWNADESYLILYQGGHHLYHGKTYAYIRNLNIAPRDMEQFYWHATDPDVLFYVDGSSTLIRYHVSTGVRDSVKTFSCTGANGGGDPMFMSFDSDVIGLRCGNGNVFAYKISTNTEGTKVVAGGGNAPIASASGNTVFLANGGRSEVRDLNMNLLRTLPVNSDDHASLGRLADGSDTHNAVSFGTPSGSLVTTDMNTAVTRVIVGPNTGYPYPPSGTHVSAMAFKKPGWVAVSVIGNVSGQGVLNNELLLANTNPGGRVCRVAHHRSYGKASTSTGNSDSYMAEPHVVISPSGTRLLFGSDWGNTGSVDSYVVELPSYQP